MWHRRILALIKSLIVSTLCISACRSSGTLLPTAKTSEPSTTPTIGTLILAQTPSFGLAIVRGRIIEIQSKKAPAESVLYLGEVKSLSNGLPVIRLERDTAPHAIPAQNGEFLFLDVEPGRYGLVLYTPEFSFLVDDPNTAKNFLLDISPNQVLDLGTIETTMP